MNDDIKAKLAKVDEELEKEQKIWKDNNLPPLPAIFNLGEQQFEVHLHMLMFTELFKELFDEDKLNLMYKRIALQELQKVRPQVLEGVRSQIRQQIVDGISFMKPKDI